MKVTSVNSEATALASAPKPSLPQVTTVPSFFSAANAPPVEKIVLILFNWAATELESPPLTLSPQVITVPSLLIAANALAVE